MMQGPMPTPASSMPSRAPPQVTKEAVFGLLKNPIQRRFKIDIENDSTVAGDEARERQDRTQFIESVTKFAEAWGPMVMQAPALGPLAEKLLLFGVRAFKVGRELEEAIEAAMQKLEAQPPQGGQGDQAKAQTEQIKLQSAQKKADAEVMTAQIGGQVAQQAGQAKIAQIGIEAQAHQQETASKIEIERERHAMKMAELQAEHQKTMAKAAVDSVARREQTAQQKQVGAKKPDWPKNVPGF